MKKQLYSMIGTTFLIIGLTGCSFGNIFSTNNNSSVTSSVSTSSTVSSGSTSSGSTSSNDDSEVVLTQRQQDILEELGLPTDYDELTISQQDSIVEIENMLSYAEDKYGISFSYRSYYPASIDSYANMKAYPTSGSKNLDFFTITKTADGYEDDYINEFSEDAFCEYMKNAILSQYPDCTVEVYCEITETSLTEIATEDTNFDGKVNSIMRVFVGDKDFDEQSFTDLQNFLNDYLTEHKLYSNVGLFMINQDDMIYLTKYNFSDYQLNPIERELFYVKE